jgi:hypothetical protein
MSEVGESAMDKIKNFFHEDVKARTEISGGSWDAKNNKYTVTDDASGVRTEYSLRKNADVDTGYSVKMRSYKDLPDATGTLKPVEVTFDKKKDKWVNKTNGAKAMDTLARKPKYMGTLNESKVPGQTEPVRTLIVEPARFKEGPKVMLVPTRM